MLIIDRFEGDYAIIEMGEVMFDFPRNLLPQEAKEGDILNISISINIEETKKQKKRIDNILGDFFD